MVLVCVYCERCHIQTNVEGETLTQKVYTGERDRENPLALAPCSCTNFAQRFIEIMMNLKKV